MTSCQHCDKQLNPSEIFTKYFEAMKIFMWHVMLISISLCVYIFVQTWKGISHQVNVLYVAHFRVLVKFFNGCIFPYSLKNIKISSLSPTVLFQI